MDGSHYHAAEYQRQIHERGLGTVLFGWDGDQMAWESDQARQRTVHYVFEPGSFVPLLQAKSNADMRRAMLQRPKAATQSYVDAQGNYDLDQDPLYNGMYEAGIGSDGEPPAPLENIHFYQCDHLGTPLELTDEAGNIAWEANYKAWGEARLTISEAARKAGLKNPIRFQGQYLDVETGLHYNRFRYYDPVMGRFVSKDPIRLRGGINVFQYASNPVKWIDPTGLSAASDLPRMKGRSVPRVGSILSNAGFNKTKGNGANETWKHTDGSEVRVHKYGNKCLCPYKSGNNAHIHKEDPAGWQLNDHGRVSVDPVETHIGIRNPMDLPFFRGRSHGS
ncbi:RHS repeat-associated core domain-containing protein [Variovorax boronicumulans]|uniref:RHS repeat-associated core domain-containing protein n=2 Tax=Variovorax TaxID=34072 RepID=UPI002785ECEE|nr:RHS repeat-associated core domain-containing protein [Variovorax boronicumulans]MDQ0044216.1 RHS repeat-associated protein [Variovorax boronicumulans]